MEQKKYIPDSLMLTKEALEQYARDLREQRAKEFGMTLEQWEHAVVNGSVVQQSSGSSNP